MVTIKKRSCKKEDGNCSCLLMYKQKWMALNECAHEIQLLSTFKLWLGWTILLEHFYKLFISVYMLVFTTSYDCWWQWLQIICLPCAFNTFAMIDPNVIPGFSFNNHIFGFLMVEDKKHARLTIDFVWHKHKYHILFSYD